MVVDGDIREKLLTLAKEKKEGLASQAEMDKVLNKELDKLLDGVEEKFPELVPEDEDT